MPQLSKKGNPLPGLNAVLAHCTDLLKLTVTSQTSSLMKLLACHSRSPTQANSHKDSQEAIAIRLEAIATRGSQMLRQTADSVQPLKRFRRLIAGGQAIHQATGLGLCPKEHLAGGHLRTAESKAIQAQASLRTHYIGWRPCRVVHEYSNLHDKCMAAWPSYIYDLQPAAIMHSVVPQNHPLYRNGVEAQGCSTFYRAQCPKPQTVTPQPVAQA